MPVFVIWIAIALLAAIIELLSPTFGFIFVAGAAVVSAVAAICGIGLLGQVIAFAVALVLGLALLRPRLVGRLGAQGVPSRVEALFGHTGRVTEDIEPVRGGGRVLVDGQDWAAHAATPVASGTMVRVTGANGIRLEVEPVDSAAV